MKAAKTLMLFAFAAVVLSCGKPQYPACEGDDDCKDKGEVCVDKKCVECKSNATCEKKLGAGATCAQNMCKMPAAKKEDDGRVACKADPDCKGDEECFGGFCQK